MDQTPNLALPYILAAQAQKHVTHNEAIRALDALTQLACVSRSLVSPPAAPADGARYILPPAATGVWTGAANRIAAYQDGAWAYFTPRDGWIAWIADESAALVFTNGAWSSLSSAFSTLGINASADTTNRLTVSAPATLLNNAGAGHQLKINKAAPATTASLLYQTGFSGRAEMGTTGDDDFHVKVSADGTTWRDGLIISAATGKAAFPAGGIVTSTASTVTIAVPAQAPTIQAALDLLQSVRFEGSASGIVTLATGTYVLSAPLTCRHPQASRIVVRAQTPAALPVETDFTGVKATDEAMVRAKYKVIVECPNIGAWSATDGEAISLIQDIAFIRTGTTGTPTGLSAIRRSALVLDRCAIFGFTTGATAREQGHLTLSNCQLAFSASTGIALQLSGYVRATATLVTTSGGTGIDISHSQFCADAGLRVKSSAGAALAVANGSSALIFGANLTGNTGPSVTLNIGSTLDAVSCTLSGGLTQPAVLAIDGCTAYLNAITTSGDTTQRAVIAQRGSILSTAGTHTGTPVFSPAQNTTANNGAWTF
jgi:hypothetical protein